jgi:hypothetical protein
MSERNKTADDHLEHAGQKAAWKRHPTGLYLKRYGDVCLMIEHVGLNFRVLVTRIIDERQPEEVVYGGSARNAGGAMMMAERAAGAASVQRIA